MRTEQIPLPLGGDSAATEDWGRLLDWFARAAAAVGHKEVAWRLDVNASNLSDAINERERKDVKGRWIAYLLRMAPPAFVDEYLAIVCASHGFEPPKRKPVLTPERELQAVRNKLAELAPGVLAMIDKEMGR